MPLSLLKNQAKYDIYSALRESNNLERVPQGSASVSDVEDAIFTSHTLTGLEKELKEKKGKLLPI